MPKKDEFSRFIDAQQVRTDPFGNNRAAERLYRRAERVCAALYLLTRHVSEDEPIRREIRSEATALFEKIIELKDEMRAMESRSLIAFESSIRRLISLVRLLTAGGFVSFQNADAVIGALDELGAFVSSAQRSVFSEGMSLTREEIVGDTSPLADRYLPKDIKDRKILRDIEAVKDNVGNAGGAKKAEAAARSEGILLILRGSGELGIREICARLPDYSEKMIQRELAILIQTGRVKKDGFKRWSRYSIA